MLIHYTYRDAAGKYSNGAQAATVKEALRVFRRFVGEAAALYVVPDDNSMIAWTSFGKGMFEVQLMNHVKQRKRSGQVSASFAEQCLRRIYRGDLALADLDEHSFYYHAGAWDPTSDLNYWTARDPSHWET
ncbi:MAG: hypothetical protein ACLQBL_40615 [Polyangiaceae bacterium]